MGLMCVCCLTTGRLSESWKLFLNPERLIMNHLETGRTRALIQHKLIYADNCILFLLMFFTAFQLFWNLGCIWFTAMLQWKILDTHDYIQHVSTC